MVVATSDVNVVDQITRVREVVGSELCLKCELFVIKAPISLRVGSTVAHFENILEVAVFPTSLEAMLMLERWSPLLSLTNLPHKVWTVFRVRGDLGEEPESKDNREGCKRAHCERFTKLEIPFLN
jgi:hypothetical protein